MELIMKQMPIVLHSLNLGFIQAESHPLPYPVHRVDHPGNAADDPAADRILFPRTGTA